MSKPRELSPKCRCGAEADYIAHVFQQCPHHAHIRTKYDEMIRREVASDGETRHQARQLVDSEIFQVSGIVPESSQLLQWHDDKEEGEGEVGEVAQLDELPAAGREDELWQDGWLRIFTDGACPILMTTAFRWEGAESFSGIRILWIQPPSSEEGSLTDTEPNCKLSDLPWVAVKIGGPRSG